MYKSYKTSNTGPESNYDYSREIGIKRRSFIRRSTLFNFIIILVIAGAILALHRAGRRFLHQPGAATAEAFYDDHSDAEAQPVAIHTMTEPGYIDETEVHNEDRTAPHDEEAQQKQEQEDNTASAQEPPPPPSREVKRTGTLHRARETSWAEDRRFSVDALDNQQTRRRYQELNKGLAPVESHKQPEPEKRASYTAPEQQPRQSNDELDSEAARDYYRKQNTKLSKSPIR